MRSWGGKKRLATLARTTINRETGEALSNIEVQSDCEPETNTITVSNINSIESLVHHLHCYNCTRRLLQPSARAIVKCDKCKHTIRTNQCPRKLCVKLVIKRQDTQDLYLTVYEEALKNVIPNIANMDIDIDIAEKLLLLDNLKVTYNDDNIITELFQVT